MSQKVEARHYKSVGRYNLLSNEKNDQVVLVTNECTVSMLWDEGDAPYDSSMLPSEIAEIFRERMKQRWSTGDKELNEKLCKIEARADEFDRAFLLRRADVLDDQATKLSEEAESCRRRASYR